MANKISYYFRVLKGARLKKLNTVIDRVHVKSGKSKVFIFFDILNCAARYGAGYNDYNIFAFWDMNHAQRKTYITRMVNKKLNTMANDARFTHIFDHKDEFDTRFQAYLHRDFLNMMTASEDEFCAFFEKYGVIFAKPRVGESGKGIERLVLSECPDLHALYLRLREKNIGVVEQEIVQHEAMVRLYPHAVNSLRIVTFVAPDGPKLVYAVCKMGNSGKYVDNMENDGLCCPIDTKTHKLCGVAHTSALINYTHHPTTNVELIGYEIPYVDEAIELCLQAAMEIPEFRYIGWDVAIAPDGPLIIEGNDYPGYDFWQLPEHTPDKIGLRPYFQQYFPEL